MHQFNFTLAFFGLPGGAEWIILLVLGLLIFGRRLPEVGKSLGRSIVEFKRGIKGIEDDVEEASTPKLKEGSSTPELNVGGSSPGARVASTPSEKSNPYVASEGAGEH